MSASLSGIWAALPIAAILIDAEDRIAEANNAAEMFLNLSSKTILGEKVWELLAVDAPLDTAFARVRSAHAPLSLHDVDVGTGSRVPSTCDVLIAPMPDSGDHVLILLHPREIADRLGRAHSSKSAARSAIGMAEMLAHEIKNPLAGIAGAAQLLSMNLSNGDRELTDLIVAETRRIVKLLEQVEQFGNLQPPVRKPVNIHDILDRARKSASVGFAAHMVVEEDFDPSLPPTFADPDQLVQVFLNLFKNAAQVCDEKGILKIRTFYELSLRVRRDDGSGSAVPLQIEIIDNGPGIPPDIASQIFDPFVSGRENGTGLGLALVSKIITEHDGWISVSSVPGKTVFRISLPVAELSSDAQG